tara:strand:- start:392 stop:760 length:369 start_codon:yes stop_codon:yes gene_type:complete
LKKLPKFVHKGWGYEKWIANSPEYCGKLLFIKKNHRCSWHYHTLKDETFYLQSGKIQLSYSPVSSAFPDDRDKAETITLEPGDAFHCTRGTRHQMLALEDAELFEFSTQHFDSDSNRVIPGD